MFSMFHPPPEKGVNFKINTPVFALAWDHY